MWRNKLGDCIIYKIFVHPLDYDILSNIIIPSDDFLRNCPVIAIWFSLKVM